jgi:serine/threonine protein kinase/Flp pilus assembly protein TadD
VLPDEARRPQLGTILALFERHGHHVAATRGRVENLLTYDYVEGAASKPTQQIDMPPTVGSVVSHYRLDRRLGSGGMGEVFLARDLQLDRNVAIKFLTKTDDAHAHRRLLREARSVAALDHPSICAIHEVVSDPTGGDFIVMQYVEGETLAARLHRAPTSPAEAVGLAAEMARALVAAHRGGVIHRDLKPQNIVIDVGGRPKLLDFGIAKRTRSEADSGNAVTESSLTQAEPGVGTPSYMAPEQIDGGIGDARSDLFALGCVLYECLTRKRAFDGPTKASVFGKVLHVEPAAPSSVVRELTPAHDALCARLLAKAPADRFQSAEEALAALLALAPDARDPSSASDATTRILPPTPGGRRIVQVALLAIGLVAGLWVWQAMRGTSSTPAPPDAERWYLRGVEFLREGSYASARTALEQAVQLFPTYVAALSRLAESQSELDEQSAAQRTLVRISSLVPDQSRLPKDEQLRVAAVRATVLREPELALDQYLQLRDRQPDDAERWLDVGRAHEALGQRVAAVSAYERAVKVDPQYAAARLRLGVVLGQGGRKAEAVAAIDEAIRLYRAAANTEGEAEAQLRKATALTAAGDFTAAAEVLQQVRQIAPESKYPLLDLRANFEEARLAYIGGRFADAEMMARQAVNKALAAGLDAIAAAGLVNVANALMVTRRYDGADEHLTRAIALAQARGAARTEAQARLQQASLRLQVGRSEEALELSQKPLEFYAAGKYVRNEADAKNIRSRALEALERYDEATVLAVDVLRLAESMTDEGLAAVALENLAGQLTKLGRLPEALATRVRIEKIHREKRDIQALAFDLPNRAELLILLGHGAEAEQALQEVDRGAAEGVEAFVDRKRRVALLRALRATTEERFAEVETLAAGARPADAAKPDGISTQAQALVEWARAAQGRSRIAVAEIVEWPSLVRSPTLRRELSYWVGLTALARGDRAQAGRVVDAALADTTGQRNLELLWRLRAVSALAVSDGAGASKSASTRRASEDDLARLLATWPQDGPAYVARPDTVTLRRRLNAP